MYQHSRFWIPSYSSRMHLPVETPQEDGQAISKFPRNEEKHETKLFRIAPIELSSLFLITTVTLMKHSGKILASFSLLQDGFIITHMMTMFRMMSRDGVLT